MFSDVFLGVKYPFFQELHPPLTLNLVYVELSGTILDQFGLIGIIFGQFLANLGYFLTFSCGLESFCNIFGTNLGHF